ncbi:DUF6090 family protein [Fulvivirga sedimenti]|uniref:Uncharacterized protein n=1 Tax=Fulvivirga sedimenti TaxID=2879465 RepID=A0A9X1HMM0_9BACT|nr:DUF6090 family protein [Fulvivirga sedimenti]MCA6074646.1 hypothetical protein [Fulvivirga sedimenti]MCA6075823.1 hypothetical protein [Fulvivirga sedimenti]MCA6076951.1 hypothetical protein [Fulvivirga sedimenti]
MITLFRKIRRKLLTQNSFTRYILYASGEIVLVVIGILIALQINSWNQQRKDRQQEQIILNQLHQEFMSNLDQLDEKIGIRKSIIHSSLRLYDYIDHPELRSTDSIYSHVSTLGIAPTFDPIINDLIGSGKLQLLQNQELKERLSLWTSEIIQLTEEEQNWLRFRDDHFMQFVILNFNVRNIDIYRWNNNSISAFLLDRNDSLGIKATPSQHADNLFAILDIPVFENLVARGKLLNEIANLQSYALRKRIVEIISLIEKEMNTKPEPLKTDNE